MGDEVEAIEYTRERRHEYRAKVRTCLDVFERMLAQSSFDFEKPLTGMEIEFNLVDSDWQPAMSNAAVLEQIADPAFQTEIGAYNIEFNVAPRPLPKANSQGAHIVMIGILPTVMPEHFEGSWMSPSTRYEALNDSIFSSRGEDLIIDISGPEPLTAQSPTIAPESACTSMQLHLQVAPHEFAANWNAAQLLLGPQLAMGANSPYFFGHQLWAETRVELFTQATDTRPEELKNQGVRPRVFFGERWIRCGQEGSMIMATRKRHSPEQVVRKLTSADRGVSVASVASGLVDQVEQDPAQGPRLAPDRTQTPRRSCWSPGRACRRRSSATPHGSNG